MTQNNLVKGSFMGQPVNAKLDHKLAVHYFRKYSDPSYSQPKLETELSTILSILQKDSIEPEDLRYLSNEVSVDFATLYFIRNTYHLDKHKKTQDIYRNYLLKNNESEDPGIINSLKEYTYVFIPGLFYKRHSDKGGDMASQRHLLNSMGLTNYLVEIKEAGSVLENAFIISNELKRLSKIHPKIIVISASKGSPDLAYALGSLMSSSETKAIKAWISIGGVLRGSKIADDYLKGIKRLLAKIVSFFVGTNIEYIKDLSSEKSVTRHNSLMFPKDLLIIHYVGAPLSSQVKGEVKRNFIKLSKIGPNDGLTALTDELTSQGTVITELGLDHYYNDRQIHKKSIALLYTAHRIIEQKTKHLGDRKTLGACGWYLFF